MSASVMTEILISASDFKRVKELHMDMKAERLILDELKAARMRIVRYSSIPHVVFIVEGTARKIFLYPEDTEEYGWCERIEFEVRVQEKIVRNLQDRCFYDTRTGYLHYHNA